MNKKVKDSDPNLLIMIFTCRNCDLLMWNMNWGYSVKLSGSLKELGSSLLYSPNFWH